jgi:CheY-like chemotaxis protein
MKFYIDEQKKAKLSDKLKSAFLANMSHEIRTPMNGILGFAELLKNPNLSGTEQQEYLRIIEKSGMRMLNIINDIIDISKIESGLMQLDIKEINFNEQLEYIYTFFKPEVEIKGITFLYNKTLPSKIAILKTDGEKLFAILTNLVKNAIKYSNNGTIEIGYLKKDAKIEFYVKDTGIGIPKNRQAAIFERFIQADITDKMAHQGAGLGLSITKAYVEMLDGKIWVESEENKGSTFYFTLPYTTDLKEKVMNKKNDFIEETASPHAKYKILIVEDEIYSQVLLSKYLNDISKEISIAKDGFEAIEICRKHPDIDLILMDILMPNMNGYEATKEIRKFNSDVIIIAQTAYGLSGDRQKSIEAGCNDYIAKPINHVELLSLIHTCFN